MRKSNRFHHKSSLRRNVRGLTSAHYIIKNKIKKKQSSTNRDPCTTTTSDDVNGGIERPPMEDVAMITTTSTAGSDKNNDNNTSCNGLNNNNDGFEEPSSFQAGDSMSSDGGDSGVSSSNKENAEQEEPTGTSADDRQDSTTSKHSWLGSLSNRFKLGGVYNYASKRRRMDKNADSGKDRNRRKLFHVLFNRKNHVTATEEKTIIDLGDPSTNNNGSILMAEC